MALAYHLRGANLVATNAIMLQASTELAFCASILC